jgi:hypothetical protein
MPQKKSANLVSDAHYPYLIEDASPCLCKFTGYSREELIRQEQREQKQAAAGNKMQEPKVPTAEIRKAKKKTCHYSRRMACTLAIPLWSLKKTAAEEAAAAEVAEVAKTADVAKVAEVSEVTETVEIVYEASVWNYLVNQDMIVCLI